MPKTLGFEFSDDEFSRIEEAAEMLDISADELAGLAVRAVARHARARGRLRLPIRLEGDPIRPRAFELPDEPDIDPPDEPGSDR